jgi:hypothetical protein
MSEWREARNRRAKNTAVDGPGYKDFGLVRLQHSDSATNEILKFVCGLSLDCCARYRMAIQGQILVLVKRFLKGIFLLSILAANDGDLTFT